MTSYVDKIRVQGGSAEIKVPSCRVIALNDEAEVLLQYLAGTQCWSLPCGDSDGEESAVDSAIKNTLDQTGLELQDLECVGFSSAAACEHVFDDSNYPIHCHALIFVSTHWRGELLCDSEQLLQHQFFSLNALPELKPNMLHTLNMFKQWIQTRMFQIS